jgi:DNA-damage-inducible protein D
MPNKSPTSSTPVIAEGQFEIAEFRGKTIRKVLNDDEWYFSIVDVIEAVTENERPRKYWNDLKKQLVTEGFQLSENIGQLKMPSADGKSYLTDAANTETMFRIIQSIPSKKAEPFKRWLAKVGYERILEFQNPDIAIKRAILDYKVQGHQDEWIDARVRSIMVRQDLTSEWSRRGVKEGPEYGILTNVIQEEIFGVGVKGHKSIKGLKKNHNLRDHMTSTELIFTMLGERSTKDITIASDARGFPKNKVAAQKGGKVAGDARIALETETNQRVVSQSNFLKGKGSQGKLKST